MGESRLHLLPADPLVTVRVEAGRRWPRPRLPAWVTRRRALLAAAGLVLLVVLTPGAFIGVACYGRGRAAEPPPDVRDAAAGIEHYFRSEASTYLTLPEWHIIYAADAYAAVLRDRRPSQFPYFRAIGQYWSAYRHACGVTKRAYPFEAGTHLMLGVLGLSFSVEHAVKGVYEKTAGRAVEWVASRDTQEDAFAYEAAQAYGSFLHTTPWYDFPFGRTLVALWRSTDLWGPHPLRKWERKLVLSAEYGLKGVYARVIRLGTKAVPGSADLTIHARIAGASDAIFADTRIRKVKALARRSYIVNVPRYEAFTEIARRLTTRGVRFLDIAGNDEILLTAVVPRGFRDAPVHGALVFGAPLLEDDTRRRVALKVPVRALHEILPALERRGARIEHLYDY